MMYAATLLTSLLASAHGFASSPLGASPTACFRNGVLGEKFFVYSIDFTAVFPYLESLSPLFEAGNLVVPPEVTRGRVGKMWEGLQLSITKGDISITEAGGRPLTLTSPIEFGIDLSTVPTKGYPTLSNAAYVSEDFCLPHGEWTVKMNEPTYNYTAIANEPITYPPAVELYETIFGNESVINASGTMMALFPGGGPFTPFNIRWDIYPNSLRELAVEALGNRFGGADFTRDLRAKNVPSWSGCEVNYEQTHVVPAPKEVGRRLSFGGVPDTCN